MSEVLLTERLDEAINSMLSAPLTTPPSVDQEIAELLEIAAELRALPRAEFKARLKDELQREVMSGAPKPKPRPTESRRQTRPGFRTVTPYITVADVHQEIEFIQTVFGAEGKVYGLGSAGGFHSEYRIGDSMLMIGGGGKGSDWKGAPAPVALHAYVADVDGVYQTAIQAGARSLMPPTDMEYGERGAAIEDTGGNHWYLATAFGSNYIPEGSQNVMPVFHPVGAPKMIDFLKQALGAEEVVVYKSPDGVVQHAQLKIGDSIVEMGEAHGPWQSRPMHFMLYVDDSDAWYQRAMKVEGAVSLDQPSDQPYGARVGTVKDPFDNVWYLATPLTTAAADSLEPERKTMAPKLFRVALQVADLDQAAAFYAQLLNDPGIRIARGSRHYFDCGAVILALVDVAKGAGEGQQPTPDYIYFAVNNLEEIFARAQALNCLAKDRFHEQNAGEIVRRPWGEVSFYVEDPWGNGLCFVDETTLFTGK